MNAVILAGGRGTRLRPFTTNFPKPLMPIGDIPILEILLRQLRGHGVLGVTVMSGHLAYLIEAYFGNGAALGLEVTHVREAEPLGTAGPLKQLRGRFSESVLVLNGDLLTDLDYRALVLRQRETGSAVGVAVSRRDERIDLGVVQIDKDRVVGYDEKPVFKFDVSMGAYAIEPRVLDLIPDGHYDMPQLVLDLLDSGESVLAYRHEGMWLDIGRPDDYERANQLFSRDARRFLPDESGEVLPGDV